MRFNVIYWQFGSSLLFASSCARDQNLRTTPSFRLGRETHACTFYGCH